MVWFGYIAHLIYSREGDTGTFTFIAPVSRGGVEGYRCIDIFNLRLHLRVIALREMENISRSPTFRDFVTIRTEASMQDVTVARLPSTRIQTPLSPPSFKCNVQYCVKVSLFCGQSKYSLRNTKEKGAVGNLCISVDSPNHKIIKRKNSKQR